MAKLGIEVEVKAKHIKKGESKSKSCPIALALIETFNLSEYDTVSVNSDEISIEKSNGVDFNLKWSDLPIKVEKFVLDFDNSDSRGPNRKVKPFTFTIPLN